MATYSRAEAAERAGLSVDDLGAMVESGILRPGEGDTFSDGDVRRISLVRGLESGGISQERLGQALRSGDLTLDFMDDAAYQRFSSLTGETFAQLSSRTGVSVQLLMVMREAIGAAMPTPEDRVREDEMAILPLIQTTLANGFRPIVIERFLRVMGDSLRRIAQTESDAWASDVIGPMVARGLSAPELGAATSEVATQVSHHGDDALLAIFHAQQAHAWTSNIVAGFELMLEKAGLASRLERPPAMCFLDITGYTRLTQERGDAAAAELAAQLARVVERTSILHGGRPIKWLGDGVMFFFRDPGPGVLAALEMVDGVAGAGLPPAHVGLHAGPVIFQEGDYYGQTVNVASRIAEYARPGEVLVSQEVVDASGDAATFTDIGPVELKGVAGAMHLHAAHRG